MPWFSFRRFTVVRRRADGRYDLVLSDDHRVALTALLGELATLIEDDPHDADLRRLWLPAYLEDDERDAENQLLAGDELRTSRRDAIETVRTSISKAILEEGDLWSWLQALNALRLVVGTKLGIDDDEHDVQISPDDPDAPMWAIYDFASQVQQSLVQELSG